MYKQEAHLVNSIGIIDHEYTGNIKAPIACENPKDLIGKRILQLTVHKQPKVELVEVDELSDTQRGSKGFGSSGT
jgi:dUTP pyrophosphatase